MLHRLPHYGLIWYHLHTFSAFWLRSSVVSVLISVTTDILPTGRLLVTPIFLWGGCSLSLLEGTSRVALALHQAGRGTPLGVILIRILILKGCTHAHGFLSAGTCVPISLETMLHGPYEQPRLSVHIPASHLRRWYPRKKEG